jgi:hypothetical protein
MRRFEGKIKKRVNTIRVHIIYKKKEKKEEEKYFSHNPLLCFIILVITKKEEAQWRNIKKECKTIELTEAKARAKSKREMWKVTDKHK